MSGASGLRKHSHSSAGDGGTLSTVTLPTASSPSQTAEGSAVWDSDDDKLTVGTGSGRKTLVNEGAVTTSGLTQATGKLLGRSTASTGAVEEITVGTNLTLAGGTLDATGGGGGGWETAGADAVDLEAGRDSIYDANHDASIWMDESIELHGGSAPGTYIAMYPEAAGYVAVEDGVGLVLPALASDPTAVRDGHVYYDTATDVVRLRANGAWTTLGAGSVATDAIWDAAGDLAVGSGANTAARLAIGNAGGHLSRINGTVQWDSRTSMPTAATSDRVWRTDLEGEWFYNGTTWLSSVAHEMAFPLASAPPLSATGVLHRMIMPAALGGSDVYLAAVLTSFFVAGGTALSGSHKWVATVSKANTAGSASLGTITIDSGASDQWRAGTALSINAAADVASGYVALEINWVKTGTPGSLYANCSMAYRTIAT